LGTANKIVNKSMYNGCCSGDEDPSPIRGQPCLLLRLASHKELEMVEYRE
jgi:hypothetical protein